MTANLLCENMRPLRGDWIETRGLSSYTVKRFVPTHISIASYASRIHRIPAVQKETRQAANCSYGELVLITIITDMVSV